MTLYPYMRVNASGDITGSGTATSKALALRQAKSGETVVSAPSGQVRNDVLKVGSGGTVVNQPGKTESVPGVGYNPNVIEQ